MSRAWSKNDIGDLTGKVVIVTGGNSGIGYETSLALAEKNATVILAVRNIHRGHEAVDKIQSICNKTNNVYAMELDLSDLSSIQRFVNEFKGKFNTLSILINNAGVMVPPYRQTKDGFESQMGINYLGHFALTGLLLDYLKKTPNSRVVSVGSLVAHKIKPEFLNFKTSSSSHSPIKYYGQSKLACMLFAKELQYKFRSHRIAAKSIACHPGISHTRLFAKGSQKITNRITRASFKLLGQSAKLGAYSVLYAATEGSLVGGEYIGPHGKRGRKGAPTELNTLDELYTAHVASNLWTLSEKATGVKFTF